MTTRVPTGRLDEEVRMDVVGGRLHLTAWRHSLVTGRYEEVASLPPVLPAYAPLLAEEITALAGVAEWNEMIDGVFDDATARIKAPR